MFHKMGRYNVFATAAKLNVSAEIIRKWCIEFERHLSPQANPGANRTRTLSAEDIHILSIVSERRNTGISYESIHAELQTNVSSLREAIDMDDEEELNPAIVNDQLSFMLARYEMLQSELQTSRQRLEELQKYREDNIRVQVQLEMERNRAEKAEETIHELLDERRELDREIARLRTLLEQKHSLNSLADKSESED
jgi:DNA-binding transcriptional MerR regulator